MLPQPHPPPRPGALRAALVGIVVVGAALRLFAIDRFPPGLHFDEAVYGLMARDIVGGARPVFFSAYTGREPLYMYVMAALFAGIGASAFAVRLTSALVGIATLPLTYSLGRALYGRRVGLTAAALLAVQYWHLTVSRNAYPNILIPPLEAASAFFLWRAWRADGRRWRDWVAAGACAGLVLYTYLAARFWPVALVVVALYALVVDRSRWRQHLPGILAAAAAAGVVFAPLGLHFARRPEDFLERANQVLAWNQLAGRDLLAAYLRNGIQTAAGFVARGDPRWHYNLPGRPIFLPVVAVLLGVGLLVCLRRVRDVRYGLPLLWTAVMCLPGVLTLEMQPAGQRIFGVFPAVVLVAALGGVTLGDAAARLARRWRALGVARSPDAPPCARRIWPIGLTATLVAGVVVLDGARTVRDYFLDWARQPETYHIFNADHVALADLARRDIADGRTVVLLTEHYKHPTVAFLAPETIDRAVWADPMLALPVPSEGRDGRPVQIYYRLVSWLPDDAPAARWLEANATRRETVSAGFDPRYVAARGATPADVVRYELPRSVAFDSCSAQALGDGEIRLPDARVLDPPDAERDEPLVVTADWCVGMMPSGARMVALHLRDQDGRTWAQSDRLGYLSEQWRPGDRVRQWHTLALDPTMPPGIYVAMLVVADAQGRALPVRWRAGDVSEGDGAPVASVRITPRGERTADASTQPLAILGDGLAIVSADPVDVRLASGGEIDVRVLWARWGVAAPSDLTFWLARAGATRKLATLPVARRYPPADWADRELLTGRYRLRVPADIADGDYRLAVAPTAADASDARAAPTPPSAGAGEGFALGVVRVATGPRLSAPPASARPIDARFGGLPRAPGADEGVRLVAWEVAPTFVRAGEAVTVTLYWTAARTPAHNATAFVHLYGPGGALVAQHDGVPADGARPLVGWTPGEVVVDRHIATVAETGAHTLTVAVGLYDPGSRLRWPVTQDGMSVARMAATLPDVGVHSTP